MDRLPSAWVHGVGDEVVIFSMTLVVIVISLLVFLSAVHIRLYRLRSQDGDTPVEHEAPPGYNRDLCPICIEAQRLPVETNCGHLFCGPCLQECYRHHRRFAMPCPLCRSQITLLFICFPSLVDGNEELETQQQEVYTFVNTYNRGCAGFPLSIWQMILDWPTTMRHFLNDLSIVGIVRFLAQARILFFIVATLFYILSPLDIFPEALVGMIGYIDDLIISAVLAIHVSIVYRRLIVAEGLANDVARLEVH